MATHDYVIDNSTGANVRADINLVLQAILTNNSSSSAPSTTAAYMWWADTTTGTLKIRNSANNAWVELLQLDGTLTLEDGSASTPALSFRDDLNTGVYSSAADTFNVATAGVERMELGATTIFNEDGADVDFRIEGDTDANLFYVNAGTNRVGIGTSGPNELLEVTGNCRLSSGGATRTLHMGPASAGIEYNVNGTTFIQGRTDAYPLAFKTQSAERMRIDSSGNVGIGTTSPSSFNADGRNLVVGTGSGGQGLSIYSANNNYGNIYFADGTSDGSYNAGGILYNHSSNFMRFDTGASERLRIDSSGNVGIGTTSPSTNLHVKGPDGSAPKITLSEGTSESAIRSTASGTSSDLRLMTSVSGTQATKLIVDYSGNVLIGRTDTTGIPASGNDLVVSSSGNMGITIQSTDSSYSNLYYVDSSGGSAPGYISYQHSTDSLQFATATNERMRIDSSGQLLVGTTSTNSCSAKLIVQADSIPAYYANSGGLNVTVTNSNNIHCSEFFQGRYDKRCITHSHSNTGSVTFDVFEQNDVTVGSITGNASNAAFNTSSDYRLKENVVNLTDGITRLKQLIPRRFNWIIDSTNTLEDGFIAHEVSPVIPEAVTGEKDALEEDGSVDPQQMDYSKLTPLLTAALQEAIAKIEVLETKVAALEAA